MICQRCRKDSSTWSMSMFNTQAICLECADKERAHPEYEAACRAERMESLRGNYNFPGIGLPADL